jgi:hypothetical protein
MACHRLTVTLVAVSFTRPSDFVSILVSSGRQQAMAHRRFLLSISTRPREPIFSFALPALARRPSLLLLPANIGTEARGYRVASGALLCRSAVTV